MRRSQLVALVINFPLKGISIVMVSLLTIIVMQLRAIRLRKKEFTFLESVLIIICVSAAGAAFLFFLTHSIQFTG